MRPYMGALTSIPGSMKTVLTTGLHDCTCKAERESNMLWAEISTEQVPAHMHVGKP